MYNVKNDKSAILYTAPVYDNLQCYNLCEDNNGTIVKDSDISLIFNQNRLQCLGDDTVRDWLNSLGTSNDNLNNLRSKCSDNQLISLIKSRHIQSLSDVLHWSEALEKDVENNHEFYRNTLKDSKNNPKDTKVSKEQSKPLTDE